MLLECSSRVGNIMWGVCSGEFALPSGRNSAPLGLRLVLVLVRATSSAQFQLLMPLAWTP